MKRTIDTGFTLLLLAIAAWTVWEARDWDIRARLFPWAVGIPMLALLGVQLVQTLRIRTTDTMLEAIAPEGVEPDAALPRTLSILGWLLAFAVGAWLLGFPIGLTLLTFVYLRLVAREGWAVSLGVTIGTAVFFWLLTGPLTVPFPPGLLLRALGVS